MSSVAAGSSVTLIIEADEYVTIDVPSGGDGTVTFGPSQKFTSNPGGGFVPAAIGSMPLTSKVYGPFGVSGTLTITSLIGTIGYTRSGSNSSVLPANISFSKYGVSAAGGSWLNTCGVNSSAVGISATVSLSNERPRFETYTRKVVLGASNSEIRFNSANFTADQTDPAFSIDIYIESMPVEFSAANPYIDITLHNSTTFGANYTRRSYSAGYLRQGWNTFKIRQTDTVSATAGAGNLPIGQNRYPDVGTGFDWTGTGQCIQIVFNNMNGQTVYIDQLRRPAKAVPVLVMGFDASGYNATDETFVTKVAPLFARYGLRSYCTMTNIYELIFSGGQAWRRIANLHTNYGWDVINHTWSHGGTEIGRVFTATSVSRTLNVVTFTVSGGHGLTVNKTCKVSIQGATPSDLNGVFDCTVTSSTVFTYTAAGVDGSGTGTIKGYTYLSEVFNANNAENIRLLSHEITDVTRILQASGFSRAKSVIAYPNNSVPELSLLQTVCSGAGVKFGRAYRGGYTFVHELGIDNPLNFGSFVMDSGTNFTRLSEIQAKVQGAIDRGEHIWIFGHYILDDENPANAAYKPVDPDYPPSQGGNPAPPSGGALAGFGGWWYLSQLRKLIENTVGPAVKNGTLLVMSPSEYANYMGGGL